MPFPGVTVQQAQRWRGYLGQGPRAVAIQRRQARIQSTRHGRGLDPSARNAAALRKVLARGQARSRSQAAQDLDDSAAGVQKGIEGAKAAS